MHALAQRIACDEQTGNPMRERIDDRDLEREPAIID